MIGLGGRTATVVAIAVGTLFAGFLVASNQLAASVPKVTCPVAAPVGQLVTSSSPAQLVQSSPTNYNFSDMPRPTGPFITNPAGAIVDGVSYDCVLTNGTFTVAQPLKGRVLVTGRAVLYIPKTGRIQFGAADSLTIAKGARLSLYSDSTADAVFGKIFNESGDAANFTYFGLEPTENSQVSFKVAPRFCGGIFAPHQKLVLVGNRSEDKDVVGSIVAREVALLETAE
jgi:hypothetical protein